MPNGLRSHANGSIRRLLRLPASALKSETGSSSFYGCSIRHRFRSLPTKLPSSEVCSSEPELVRNKLLTWLQSVDSEAMNGSLVDRPAATLMNTPAHPPRTTTIILDAAGRPVCWKGHQQTSPVRPTSQARYHRLGRLFRRRRNILECLGRRPGSIRQPRRDILRTMPTTTDGRAVAIETVEIGIETESEGTEISGIETGIRHHWGQEHWSESSRSAQIDGVGHIMYNRMSSLPEMSMATPAFSCGLPEGLIYDVAHLLTALVSP